MEKTFFRSLKNCFSAEPCLWLTFLAILAIVVVVVEALIFRKVFKDCLAQSAARWASASRSRARFPAQRFSPRYFVNNTPGPIVSSPSMREKKHPSLKNRFSAKRPFSSSYWGKQCFRSPDLSTYGFWVERKQSKHARKNNFSEPEKLFFCKAQFHPVRQYIRGHAKKMNCKGNLQTSRINSNLRIWQSYSSVPQILKVLCVWYTWKYVARLGFEPLKFLYSEFLYNTQAVAIS